MPFGVVRCSVSWVAGGAVFTSVLMIAVLLSLLLPFAGDPLNNRYQFRRLLDLNRFRLFSHMRYFDSLQYLLDAFIHLAQRLSNRAAIRLVALATHRNARRNEQWAVNRLNHFKRRNRIRVASQCVASINSVLRSQ